MLNRQNAEYICLESSDHKSKFYTMNNKSKTEYEATLCQGKPEYHILGYANTEEEARRILYPTVEEEAKAIHDYILDIVEKMSAADGY